MPRQEPGRYFEEIVVPSPGLPQRQPLMAIGPLDRFAATAGAPFNIGTKVTLPGGKPPPVATITLPLMSVDTLATYFEVTPSQPQLPAAGGVPPPW